MDLAKILILLLLFMSVTGSVFGLTMLAQRRGRMQGRIELARGAVLPGQASSVDAQAAGALQRLAEPLARFATPASDEEISRFRARFLQAGIRTRAAPTYFFAIKVLLALGLPLLFWLAIRFSGPRVQGQAVMLLLVSVAALGFYLPNLVLGMAMSRRKQELFEAFPDAIDLMIVCVEAGLSMDMAMQRTSQEMGLRSPDLADELALVGIELRIGATRERAMRNLAARTGVEEIRNFVAMLLQADRFGTSVADSMRVHAEDLRLRRQYRAEEEASKIPTKLLFPLLLTIFPALMLVLVGPAVIGLARSVLPMMSIR